MVCNGSHQTVLIGKVKSLAARVLHMVDAGACECRCILLTLHIEDARRCTALMSLQCSEPSLFIIMVCRVAAFHSLFQNEAAFRLYLKMVGRPLLLW